jgi:AcrR family transcriptional regulator
MSIASATEEKIYIEPEKTKERIYNVAVDLFFTKGFHQTSIRDIAKEGGMNSAGIYHHFGNKEGLLLFILEQASKSILINQRRSLEKIKDLNPLERFKKFLISAVHWTLIHPRESKIFLLSDAEFSSDGAAAMKQIHQEVFDNLYHELLNLENAGYLNGRNLKLLGICTEGILLSYTRYHEELQNMPAEKLSEEIASYIWGGILHSKFHGKTSDIF